MDLLGELDEPSRRAARSAATRRRFAKREVVFHEGDPGDTLHVIDSGRVAIRVTTRRGDVATLSVLGAGTPFGEMAVLDPHARRTASVVALEPTTTLSFSSSSVGELRAAHPAFDRAITELLTETVRRLSSLVLEALYLPAEARVALRLHELASIYRASDGSSSITLTQDDVASMAGTSRATVNRVVGALAEEGALRVARGRIDVLDAELIARAAK